MGSCVLKMSLTFTKIEISFISTGVIKIAISASHLKNYPKTFSYKREGLKNQRWDACWEVWEFQERVQERGIAIIL